MIMFRTSLESANLDALVTVSPENATRKQIGDFLKSKGLYMPNNMLSVGNDAKTAKGQKYDYLTGVLYMIPDFDICPASLVADCYKACLVSAGRGKFNSVIAGRENKTQIYKRFPNVFYELVRRDIARLKRKAEKLGLNYCVRLNGTSDISHHDFIESMPDVQFYDYTKRTSIVRRASKLDNYHVTFSYSGVSTNYRRAIDKAIALGANIAVVFSDTNQPTEFLGLPVINGDDSDLRFLDYKVNPSQSVIGLYAKGEAKKDTSGFVVNTNIIAVG